MKFNNYLFFYLTFIFSQCITAQIVTNPSNKSVCTNEFTSFETKHSFTNITNQTWQVRRSTTSKWINLTNTGCYADTDKELLLINVAPDSINGFEYRFFIKHSSGTDSSLSAKITVNALPIAPSVSNTNISLCKNSSTITLSATASSGCTLNWYNSATGGTPSTTAPSITPSTPGVIKYYVSQKNSTTNCEGPRTEIIVTINDLPTTPTVSSKSISYCQNQSTTQLTASGSFGCTLYWYTSSTAITGNTTAPTPSSSSSGITIYYVGQTNNTTLCESSRNDITVTIDALPAISSSPSASTICEGSNTTFSISASGTGINYQWQVDNGSGSFTNINTASSNPTYSGFNAATLSLTGIPSSINSYLFRCVVSGKCNPSVNSNSAKITVNTSPKISSQPASIEVCEGGNTSFSCSATGTGLNYQWQVDIGSGWQNITSSSSNPSYQNFNSNLLGLNGVIANNNGYNYRCIISGTCSPQATSTTALLTVLTKPQIQNNPSDITTCEGAAVSFSINATGSRLLYQWQLNKGSGWQDITNSGSSPTYSNYNTTKIGIDNIINWNDGYQYRCVVSGACSPTTTSSSAKLNVDIKPIITSQPQNITTCFGDGAQLACRVYGTRLNYQWQVFNTSGNWLNIDTSSKYNNLQNYKTDNLIINNSKQSNTYRLQISNPGCAGLFSNSTIHNVNPLPTVDAGKDQEICTGTNTKLRASAVGSNNISFEWQPSIGLDNNKIPDPLVNTLNSTLYKVTVIDSNNCKNYDEVLITINSSPQYKYSADKSAICLGDAVTLGIQTNDSIVISPKSTTQKISNNKFLLKPSVETNYKLLIRTTKNCTDSFSVPIKINPQPKTDAGVNRSICLGDEIQLNGSGANYFQWRSDSTLSNLHVSNPTVKLSKTKMYWLTGTNIFGCQTQDSVIITVNPNPSLELLSKLETCSNVPKQINIKTSASKIQWEPQQLFTNANSINPIFKSEIGSAISVTVEDANKCQTSKQFNFIVNPNPIVKAIASENNICYGKQVTLEAKIDTAIWTGPLVNIMNKQIIVSPVDNSTYILTGKNKNGCLNRDTITINVTPLPKPQIIGDTFLCKNQNWSEFAAKPTNPNSNMKWNVINGRFASGDVASNIAIHWDKQSTGKLSVTETLNSFPFCQGISEKTINLSKGESVNPTTIFVKGDDLKSGILISDNKTYDYYQWGYMNKLSKVKTLTCSKKTWCDFKKIDTLSNIYFLISNGGDHITWTDTNNNCPAITYFNPVRFASTDRTVVTQIKLYPNPVIDKLYISSPFPIISVLLYNNLGQYVKSKFNTNEIDVSDLKNGTYNVEINGEDHTFHQTIIVIN